jgi:hypothetical protein
MICMIVFFVNFLAYDGKVKKNRKRKKVECQTENCCKEMCAQR